MKKFVALLAIVAASTTVMASQPAVKKSAKTSHAAHKVARHQAAKKVAPVANTPAENIQASAPIDGAVSQASDVAASVAN